MGFTLFCTIVVLSFLAFMLYGIIRCICNEKKAYNNGICTKCGGKLYYFSTDIYGRRGYHCEHCGKTIWMSFNISKPRKEE